MAKILHIESSPRKERSHSIKVAQEFIRSYKKNNPDTEIETLDIWGLNLPIFDGDVLTAKYAVIHGDSPTQTQQSAWSDVQKHFAHFNNADIYLISTPMWNFGIPYRLKHYIDVITQPGMAWSYTPEEGYKGLLQNKKAIAIYSSGDSYAKGTGFEAYDLQKPYLNLWLNFIGITDISIINVEATLFADRCTEDRAMREAAKLGGELK